MSRRTLPLLSLLFLSVLAAACESGPPPEDKRPEITLEKIREGLNGKYVEVPAEDDASKPTHWRFFPGEPKEIKILETQLSGERATVTIDLLTRTSPRSEEQGYKKKLAGRLRLHYELQTGFALRTWEIVRIDNISFAFQKE
jgi:hypothetical protein